MLDGVPARAVVVPLEPIVNVTRATNVVPRQIAVASEDIDESSANALHVNGSGIFRATETI